MDIEGMKKAFKPQKENPQEKGCTTTIGKWQKIDFPIKITTSQKLKSQLQLEPYVNLCKIFLKSP